MNNMNTMEDIDMGDNNFDNVTQTNNMGKELDKASESPLRRAYLDNIRFITVCIVVIYHVIYIFNGVQPFGVIGPFKDRQIQDAFQYITYPWFMALLFVVSGMSSRYYLEKHSTKSFIKDRTRKLLVPSTLGLFAFHCRRCPSRYCMWLWPYREPECSGSFRCCGCCHFCLF